MKKFLISLNLILLAQICAINVAYCTDDFFADGNFDEVQNIDRPEVLMPPPPSQAGEIKKPEKPKKSKKSKKKSKKEDKENKGYYGTLPNIYREYAYKKQSEPTSEKIDAKIPTEEDLERENLKQAPFDDTLFLDKVIKKEKTSTYVNDLQRTKYAMMSLKKCIEENGNIQYFNGCVNTIDLFVKSLKAKYENSSESLHESYIDILSTCYCAKVMGNLLYDANYYARYIPTKQGKYSKENIEKEKQILLNKLNKTIFLINQEK